MNKNKAWWLLSVFLLVLVSAPFWISEEEDLEELETKKQIEIKGSRITGYQKGKLNWSVYADYVWTGRSKFIFRAEKVLDGQLYDSDGQLIVDHIKADRIRVNSKSKTLSAYDQIEATFQKREVKVNKGLRASEKKKKKINITADELRYFSLSKRTYLYKNVKIKQKDAIVYPSKGVEVDNDNNIAYIDGGFLMKSDEFVVSGNQMTIYIDDDYSEMSGDITAIRIGKPTTNITLDQRERDMRGEDVVLTCDYLKYSDKDNQKVIEINGNIHIQQAEKQLRGEKGYYNQEKNIYRVDGNVQFLSDSLGFLLDKNRKATFENPDMSKAIQQRVTVNANQFLFEPDQKKLELMGNVRVDQVDKKIKAKKIQFLDEKNKLILKGNVEIIKDDQDTISCEFLEIDINSESFYAGESVQTEFKVKKNKDKP
ncbi:MAG: hypothetical protein CL521_02460 [Actinobacteria bacterium]|nr:hypothetical protein [Actinomycetota bacterium]